MKLLQRICLTITILFCIDYSIATLLDFSFLFDYMQHQKIIHKLYAFTIGVSAFINILLYQKEKE